jgi:hypothetical protein
MIISFYNEHIPAKVIEYQKKVFEHLGQPIKQINPEIWEGHGLTIDTYLKNTVWDYVIIFDIDCIPLNKIIIPFTINWITSNTGLFSVAQKASHIPNSIIYASPAFIAFSKQTFEILGSPTFTCTPRSDTGGELTHLALEKGLQVRLMMPVEVQKKLWHLTETEMFGLGTNYENQIYHQFYSRKNMSDSFYTKCNEVMTTKF